MISLQKTDATNPDFHALVKLLDQNLLSNYQEAQSYYDQFNKLEDIKQVVIAYQNKEAIGCGAIKHFDESRMEVKRMYVVPQQRGLGVASQILQALENWAKELGYSKCVLETGTLQKEAIALYLKKGYLVTPNYGQYIGMETSVCFEKNLYPLRSGLGLHLLI